MGGRSADRSTTSVSSMRWSAAIRGKRGKRCRLIFGRCARIHAMLRATGNQQSNRTFSIRRPRRMAKLGFIGLGVMGSQMVNRLLDKGHVVTGYNRTRSKAQWLVDRGMNWGDSPRAVSAAADVTFSMVTNTEALKSVSDGPDGFLAGFNAGKVLIDMSTVSPAASRALAAKIREKGADMVDAPVSGSVITLQEGKLSVMVAGRRETFERVKPLLQDIGPKVTYVGENGLALSMKIAINLSLAVQMLAFS